MYITPRTVVLLKSVLCLACILLWSGAQGSNSCRQQERKALLDLEKARTTLHAGARSAPNESDELWVAWDHAAANCCEWQGITCDAHSGRVTELRLPSCEGDYKDYFAALYMPEHCYYVCSSLPPSLSQLQALKVLDLHGGCFYGNISPHILTSLENLTHLDLSNNFLRIPTQLPPLPKLTYFNFSYYLSIDESGAPLRLNLSNLVRALPNLRYLDIRRSMDFEVLEGFSNLPSEFSASFLPHLAYLDLSYNGLQGIIPDQLGSLESLIYLNLEGNRFRNPLPWQSLANLSQLAHLTLGNIHDDDVEVLVWEQRQAHWHCKWKALESVSCQKMRFASHDSTPFCLGEPTVMSKLKTLSFKAHYGSIGPLLHSMSLINGSLDLKDLLLPRTSLAEFQAWDWLHPLTMPFLESLDVSGNLLTSLPSWLPVQLPLLQRLDISGNGLSDLPSNLQQLHSLRVLDISVNSLTVSLGQLELQNFTQLQIVRLSGNSITGSANLLSHLPPLLSVLDLRDNELSGAIPFSIGNMSMLSYLDLSYNSLSGVVPLSLGRLSRLFYLDLSQNNLSGELPASMENLTALGEVELSHNYLTGSIPPFFLESLQLYSLGLSHNHLVGNLPPTTQNCSSLGSLDLSSNNLSGGLSQLFQNCRTLVNIYLSNNSLSGPLPQIHHDCWAMSELDLSSNDLSGALSDQTFTNCGVLSMVNLGRNSFSFGIPASVASLKWLKALTLDHNNLSGGIPVALHKCRSLVILDLSYNQLSGRIPSWITGTNFPSMAVLMLSNNQFQGSIPLESLANLTCLQILGLASNHLSGIIPTHLDHLVGMTYEGKPSELEAPVTVPMKGANWPLSYSILNATLMLDLSNNLLQGPIPPQIGALKGLRILNLSRNALCGPIPGTLGNLSSALESLDLSHNQLTGGIPLEFCSFNSLGYLDVSNNHLSGTIPQTCPHLSSYNASAFSNNEGLCGSPLPQCAAPAPPQEAVQAETHASMSWFARVQEVVSVEGLGIGYALGLFLTSLFLHFRVQLASLCRRLLSDYLPH